MPLAISTGTQVRRGAAVGLSSLIAAAGFGTGTGVSRHPVGGFSGSGTWVQDFALPRRRRAPSHKWGPPGSC